ncbi:2-dehydropantoate 2-reductase [Brevifollis gellanilyticus]|uniref:2-dehydropantoate 2-reductase n=1 Tax=Brevifollis gellanilyticus TaxID=748831 RepID=A0A512MD98_9BACT|nr:2-dehydropantoate 2-reductase [Brevifollis gellanilyticus]GEP44714.1 2-dehydropantoate 2-reductase [Brevifollis gellanilyticus]
MSLADPLPDRPRIAIVGAGAVGCYYGGRLAEHGHDVHFLMRSDYDAVMRDGLHISSPLGDAHLQVQAHRSAQDIGPCDLVIIALKATSNPVLLEVLPPLMHDKTLLLTFQNGLGNEEFLAEHFGVDRVLGGLCFVCINRTAPGRILHIAQGRINLGEHTRSPLPRTHGIAEAFQASKIDCVIEPSLAAARWKKLVWNIPFNGLSIAAGGIDTAAILADPALEQRVRDLMHEIITTARALGHEVSFDLIHDMIERTRTMSGYRPSSLIDFDEGREVELEPIWGAPVRQAELAGLTMPRVSQLLSELRSRIQSRASCSD